MWLSSSFSASEESSCIADAACFFNHRLIMAESTLEAVIKVLVNMRGRDLILASYAIGNLPRESKYSNNASWTLSTISAKTLFEKSFCAFTRANRVFPSVLFPVLFGPAITVIPLSSISVWRILPTPSTRSFILPPIHSYPCHTLIQHQHIPTPGPAAQAGFYLQVQRLACWLVWFDDRPSLDISSCHASLGVW